MQTEAFPTAHGDCGKPGLLVLFQTSLCSSISSLMPSAAVEGGRTGWRSSGCYLSQQRHPGLHQHSQNLDLIYSPTPHGACKVFQGVALLFSRMTTWIEKEVIFYSSNFINRNPVFWRTESKLDQPQAHLHSINCIHMKWIALFHLCENS